MATTARNSPQYSPLRERLNSMHTHTRTHPQSKTLGAWLRYNRNGLGRATLPREALAGLALPGRGFEHRDGDTTLGRGRTYAEDGKEFHRSRLSPSPGPTSPASRFEGDVDRRSELTTAPAGGKGVPHSNQFRQGPEGGRSALNYKGRAPFTFFFGDTGRRPFDTIITVSGDCMLCGQTDLSGLSFPILPTEKTAKPHLCLPSFPSPGSLIK